MARYSNNRISIVAPAKVNLYLHILAKRKDGYHTIESLVAFTNIGDKLTVAPSNHLKLTTNGPFSQDLCANDDNLIIKAAKNLAKSNNISPTAAITLTKNLPVSAGIGGGSSDAAAVLNALSTLWSLSPNANELNKVAKTIGADVPACLASAPSIIRGIGEKIFPFHHLPEMWLVLANPGCHIATEDAFASYQEKFSKRCTFNIQFKTAKEFINILSNYNNDLTQAAIKISPIISTVLKEIAATKNQLLSRLSGSGATCYGLYEDENSAVSAADYLKLKYPEWWVQTAKLQSHPQKSYGGHITALASKA